MLDGENRKYEYTLDPNTSKYDAPEGLYDYLEENQDGTFTLVKKHGTELDFDINGNLSSIIDENGNYANHTITISINPEGNFLTDPPTYINLLLIIPGAILILVLIFKNRKTLAEYLEYLTF